MKVCLICKQEFKNKRSFSTHLQKAHKITSLAYTINFLYNGSEPKCSICEKTPRYVSFSFKEFCKEHSRHAQVKGGGAGGRKKKTWNKNKTKKNDLRLMKLAKKFSGKGNPFYKKRHSDTSISKMKESSLLTEETFRKRIERRQQEFEVLTKYDEYFSRQHQYLDVKCLKCDRIEQKTLQAFERGSLCKFCYPENSTSHAEQELVEFIESLGIKSVHKNTKQVIPPYELDLFFPEHNFAIEYNGLYFHCELFKEKKYHRSKTNFCRDRNIQLFHIFEDEWRDKRLIVESMIQNRLKITPNTIFARKCIVKQIEEKNIVKNFFERTHISGKCQTRTAFGLFYNNELVACVSLRKPIQKKYQDTIEIARFSTELNTSVVGGFGKIMKAVEKWSVSQGYKNVLTYADLRFGVGNLYKKMGYEELGETSLDYWYTDGKQRFFRFKFRAKKPLTEKQVAEQNGVSRIYGCGNKHFIKRLS